jgi:hypothetical protein
MKYMLAQILSILLPAYFTAPTNLTPQAKLLAFVQAAVIDVTGAPPKSDMTTTLWVTLSNRSLGGSADWSWLCLTETPFDLGRN